MMDVSKALPVIKGWGLDAVDLRGYVNGRGIEFQSDEELRALKSQLADNGLKVGVLQTSLCKVHLPDEQRQKAELEKLEGIIRAADALGTRLVRAFNYWQPEGDLCGTLGTMPDMMQRVLDMFAPVAKRAQQAGLVLGFEDCGQTAQEVANFVNLLGVPGWGLAWDLSNDWERMEQLRAGDDVDYLLKYLPMSVMVHVKAMSILPELQGAKVPWARALAAVLASGRDLPISVETHNPAKSPFDHVECSRRTAMALRKVWPTAVPTSVEDAVKPEKAAIVRPYHDDPVRFVVVGLGMGRFRSQQLLRTSGCKLVGVCDLNADKVRKAAEDFGVKGSTNLQDFLDDESVEVIYAVTPTGAHGEVAMKALAAGKHVLSTKPFDASAAACRAMIALAQEKGLLLGVDFDNHHKAEFLTQKAVLASGWFGRVLSANMTLKIKRSQGYYDENGAWRGTWRLDGGGAMANQGVHEVDRMVALFGMPDRVRCNFYTQAHNIETEDLGTAVWEYKDGPVLTFTSTTDYAVNTWYQRFEIQGTEGVMVCESGGPQGEHTYWWKDEQWGEEAPVRAVPQFLQGSDNFAAAVRGLAPISVPAQEGIKSRIVLDAMYASGRADGAWMQTANF